MDGDTTVSNTKRIFALLLVLMMLLTSACSSNGTREASASPSPESAPAETQSLRDDAFADPEAALAYTIVTEDASALNNAGEKLADIHCQRLSYEHADGALALIEEDLKSFAAEQLSEENTYELREYLDALTAEQEADVVAFPYLFTCDIRSVYADEHFLSIQMETVWYAGGVMNSGIIGRNYDLQTGSLIDISALFDGDSQRAHDAVVQASLEMISQSDDYWDNADQVILQYAPGDYQFNFDQTTIYVTYPVYELACGAAGPQTIELPRPSG